MAELAELPLHRTALAEAHWSVSFWFSISTTSGVCDDKMRHASAATLGTCPFPRAAMRSMSSASPSTTRPKSGSAFHHPDIDSSIARALAPANASAPFRDKPRACCMPWGGHRPCTACPMIHIRSLWCGAPASQAPRTPHSASYPISASSPRTIPSPRRVSIGEFSTKTIRGATSLMILRISDHSPDRSPLSPAPFPALLMSWHGKPPQTTSAIPRHGLPSKVVTSSQMGKRGRIPSRWRWSSTLRG